MSTASLASPAIANHTINLAVLTNEQLERLIYFASGMILEAEIDGRAAALAEAQALFDAINIEFGCREL